MIHYESHGLKQVTSSEETLLGFAHHRWVLTQSCDQVPLDVYTKCYKVPDLGGLPKEPSRKRSAQFYLFTHEKINLKTFFVK